MADTEWTTEDVRQEILCGFREGSVVRMRRAARFDAAMAAHDAEIAAKALAEAADLWSQGGWVISVPRRGRLAVVQALADWLRARAAALRGGGQ